MVGPVVRCDFTMPTCPKCNETHPPGTEFCPLDGEPLSGNDDSLGVAETAYGPADVHDTSPEPAVPRPSRHSQPAGDSLIGQTIGGVYRVIDLLGVGGMGIVYRVEHINLKKQFALKVLGQVAQDHPEALERFRLEAISASHIEHDNIVDIITLDSTPTGHLYIVMELLRGESLADTIHKNAPLALERALPIFYQICRALHAAHEAGIIHRDLKPENIFLTPKGDIEFVKVLDFGISKIHAAENERVRITKTGHVLGTPLYMSPEQAKGESDLDLRVDIDSLGVMFFEMLEGQPPFAGENYFQLIWKHTNEAPPELTCDAPDGLRDAVVRALSKEPENRFDTMLGFEEAVLEAVPDIPPPAFLLDYRPSTAVRPLRPSQRRVASGRGRLWAMGAVVLAVVAIAAGVFSLPGPPQREDGGANEAAGDSVDGAVRDSESIALGLAQLTSLDGGLATDGSGASGDARRNATDGVMVRLQITSTPAGALVTIGDEELGTTPVDVEHTRSDEEMTIRLVKRGWRPETRRLTLDRDHELVIPLSRRRPRAGVSGGSSGPALPIKTDF